ncbi:MAG TPA: hypothetical protein VN721_14645 [Flavipsychrobacter sp.]|nr:hypothetical protein [Flavipsychrobacter sp.]
MFPKILARIAFIILFSSIIPNLIAQPILPDIGGATEKGVVVVTWNCQYDGIKSIAVQRSSDSVHNYATVGYVKNIKKGIQAFIDGHPSPGNNWYQLYISFGSSLTWMSNRVKIHIDSSTLLNEKMVLPPNDSLQKISVTEGGNTRTIESKAGIVVTIDTSNSLTTSHTTEVKMATSVDSATIKPNIRISMAPNASDMNPFAYIKSHYVFTNPLTGHVNMELPEVREHHYSIRFFDSKDNQVLEVPKITESPIVIDKRNFEQKGIYKFILKRDNAEFETGYVTIY